jgi:hypothetical protein
VQHRDAFVTALLLRMPLQGMAGRPAPGRLQAPLFMLITSAAPRRLPSAATMECE